VIDAAWRLVSFGNAFLLGRYDGESLAKAAISQGITRWQFDTLLPRPHGIAPLRTVARDPYGWFRWLRKQGYRRLVLRWFSPADYAALDGPLKVFTTAEHGNMIVAEHERDLPMLWNVWRTGDTSGWRSPRAAKVEYRGSNVFALPQLETVTADALAAQFDAVLAEASALRPADAPAFAHARAALAATDPETMLAAAELPMLAPSTHPMVARRLMAAVIIVRRVADAYREWRAGGIARPAAFWPMINDAVLAAVNAVS
jgi:hypothetical protein